MEGLREGAERASIHAGARRVFLAFAMFATAAAVHDVCQAQEQKGKSVMDTTEVKGEVGPAKGVEKKKPTAEDIRAAMDAAGTLTFDDFRKGVSVAGVTIRVSDAKPWGTIVAGDTEWTLRGKRRLAVLANSCVITEMSWNHEKKELTTVLVVGSPLLGKRTKSSTKTHSTDQAVALLLSLCNDTNDIILTDEEEQVTGMVLTLDEPGEEKEGEDEE